MDQATLKKLLHYDPETGVFRWATTRKSAPKWKQAGSTNKIGYVEIRLNYKLYLGHRLAWIYVHGGIPDGMVIDHINGNPSDNRILNLRLGTHAQNCQNRTKAQIDSKTGVLGVCFIEAKGKYFAQLKLKRKKVWSAYFDTVEEAHSAYVLEKRRRHEFCTI
jgi:hypothetical protein